MLFTFFHLRTFMKKKYIADVTMLTPETYIYSDQDVFTMAYTKHEAQQYYRFLWRHSAALSYQRRTSLLYDGRLCRTSRWDRSVLRSTALWARSSGEPRDRIPSYAEQVSSAVMWRDCRTNWFEYGLEYQWTVGGFQHSSQANEGNALKRWRKVL